MDASKKNQIEKQIVESCISALDQNLLTESQVGEISSFVLWRIDKITNQVEFVAFLKDLSEKWPTFKPLFEIEKGNAEVQQDKKTVTQMEALIKNGNIDGALAAAKEQGKGGVL